MADYKITYNGDKQIKNIHHIGIDYNGNYYSVIFGEYVNGGFCCIPNFGVGCELSDFADTFWNIEALTKALKNKYVAKAIATVISGFGNKEE